MYNMSYDTCSVPFLTLYTGTLSILYMYKYFLNSSKAKLRGTLTTINLALSKSNKFLIIYIKTKTLCFYR